MLSCSPDVGRETGKLTSLHLLGHPTPVAMVTPEKTGVRREFHLSDITTSSTGTFLLLHGSVKPETEHVFHALLRQRQERLHCTEGNIG